MEKDPPQVHSMQHLQESVFFFPGSSQWANTSKRNFLLEIILKKVIWEFGGDSTNLHFSIILKDRKVVRKG